MILRFWSALRRLLAFLWRSRSVELHMTDAAPMVTIGRIAALQLCVQCLVTNPHVCCACTNLQLRALSPGRRAMPGLGPPWPRAVSLLYRTRCVAVWVWRLAVELSEVALAACTLHGLAESFLCVQLRSELRSASGASGRRPARARPTCPNISLIGASCRPYLRGA